PAILVLILVLILSLVLRLILGLILPATLPAILSLTLGVAGAPPVVDARLAALTVPAVIAVMAAAGVGARGHAHHQHRRKQQWRPESGRRPLSSPPRQRGGRALVWPARRLPPASPAGLTRMGRSLSPSPAGLTRGSIDLRENFLRSGWIAGSSPAMTAW